MYKGEQEGRDVAAKLPLEFSQREKVLAEAKLMEKLPKMKNLIEYVGLAKRNREPVLVTELAEGGTFDEAAEKIRGSEATVHEKRKALRRLFKGALKGLAALQRGT